MFSSFFVVREVTTSAMQAKHIITNPVFVPEEVSSRFETSSRQEDQNCQLTWRPERLEMDGAQRRSKLVSCYYTCLGSSSTLIVGRFPLRCFSFLESRNITPKASQHCTEYNEPYGMVPSSNEAELSMKVSSLMSECWAKGSNRAEHYAMLTALEEWSELSWAFTVVIVEYFHWPDGAVQLSMSHAGVLKNNLQ
jgi:hypothetical protein